MSALSDSRSIHQLVQDAITTYTQIPANIGTILRFREMLMGLLMGTFNIDLSGTFVLTSDPIEDSDDDILNLICFMATTANLIVIISNGYHSSDDRLQYLIETYRETYLSQVEFDVPFYRPNGGWILFKRDGTFIEDIEIVQPDGSVLNNIKLNGFVNAGPCHSHTLMSIGKNLLPGSRVITVGAKDDCSLGAGINQKQTDELGTLINIPDVWNNFIEMIKYTMILRNLSVLISRFVLSPNPTTLPETMYCNLMGTSQSMTRMIGTASMFFASRPPPNYGLRVNEGNSFVVGQFAESIISKMTPSQFAASYVKIEEYKMWAIKLGLTQEYYESAVLPILLTYGLGGIYKDGEFGWKPGDEQAKIDVSCLTPESAIVFKENLAKLVFLTPAYDVIAFIMLMGDFDF